MSEKLVQVKSQYSFIHILSLFIHSVSELTTKQVQ